MAVTAAGQDPGRNRGPEPRGAASATSRSPDGNGPLGTGLDPAPSAAQSPTPRPGLPVAARQRPPRGRGDSAGPGTRAGDTHLPSRPAPRPRRGSSPGAALPGGRRPRSAGPRRGRPRAPDRPRRPWGRRRLLRLLRPASPSLPAGGRRAPSPARPFSARRRRRRRGCRVPGSGGGAGDESGSGPRASAPGVGLGPWVRGSECVSHGRGLHIAREEARRRGGGSGAAGGHTGDGNGHGYGAGLRGAGRGPGHRPAPRHRGRRSAGARTPRLRSARPAAAGPRLTGQRSGDSTAPTRYAARGEEERSGPARPPGLMMAAHASRRL